MKPFWKSKVLWFNLLAAGLTALEANFNLLQPIVPVDVYGTGVVVVSVVNAVLRILTAQPLTARKVGGTANRESR
ncbi:MAG TPA: hypothetical protein PKY22_08625 [Accumulibacter sp.]|nr:hypothetical protein [Accumulibacter sp.]